MFCFDTRPSLQQQATNLLSGQLGSKSLGKFVWGAPRGEWDIDFFIQFARTNEAKNLKFETKQNAVKEVGSDWMSGRQCD